MPDVLPTPRTDLRVRRTRRLLTQALVDLSAERPLDAISIRDLSQRAQVGYATFYRHYSSIDDVLRSIVDELYTDLTELLPPLTGAQPEQAGTLVFRHVAEHPGHFRLLLGADRALGLLDTVIGVGVQGLLQTYEARPDSLVPVELAAEHFIRSFLNLIGWWLDHAMSLAPERMGEIYRDLILHPVEQAALQLRQY